MTLDALSAVPLEPECFLEKQLIRRGELMEYSGYRGHLEAQHASLYEMLVRARQSHDSTFPLTIVLMDGEVLTINPRFDPNMLLDLMMTPLDANTRRAYLAAGSLFDVNPWTYRYLIRPLGDEGRVTRLSGSQRDIVKCLRNTILGIKNYWFLSLLAGNVPCALAESASGTPINKYTALVSMVVGWLCDFCTLVIGILVRLSKCANLDWYRGLSPEVQAVVDVVCAVVAIKLFLKWTKQEDLNLVAPRTKKADQFLGQVLGEKGMVYKVRVNGIEHTLTASDEGAGCHQDEMAMPGSEYFPCRAQPVGALLVTTTDTDVQLFGTFWRMDDYLITARHCSNTLNQSTARVYLASIKSTKKGNYEVDRSNLYKAPDDFFSPENNVISSYDVDAFAREVDSKVWSQIGLTKASTKVRSAYGQQVHSVGFTGDGLLVSASGKTLADSGHEHLYHTASTQKGFSGSIILCGNSVVGMHVSAAGEHNVAVRTELIQYLIDVGSGLESNSKNNKKYTYADASYKEHYRQQKWRGGVVSLKTMRDGKYAIVLDNGEATYGWDLKGLVECFGATGDSRRDEDQFEDMIMDSVGIRARARERYIDYDDERYHRNTYENASIGSKLSKKTVTKKARKTEEAFTIKMGLKPIHGPTAPKEQPEAVQVLEDFKDEIEALGYEAGQFRYPDMSAATERKSLEAHLRLFDERVRSATKPPTDAEMKRCSSLVAEMMKAASFVPDVDYNQEAGILSVINSSIIDPKKASGYPYCVQGQPTNKQVLGAYGEKGFAKHVKNEWHNLPFEVKNFLKGEPTKISKLDKGMPRCIEGFPLHVTVKHASVFRQLCIALVKQWKNTPVKYAFAPGNPGHIEHLKSVLPDKVWESDKSNWDYMMSLWMANCTRDAVKMLAIKPSQWTEEEYQTYLTDIDECFKQVFEEATYRTSDGTAFKPRHHGIMKSGWFMTIGANSITQLVVHVMTCIRLNMTNEEILGSPIFVGGDDVNQAPVEAGVEAYIGCAKELGVAMEIHQRDSLYQAEYFSSDLRLGPEGPQYFPKRWTKHIEHLKVVKKEFLGDALISHMENYRHDVPKFDLLNKIYLAMHDKYPGDFLKSRLVSRAMLLARQYGYEHAEWF
nr:MAG: hypothetical protein 1 [Luteoviridae sp.]